MSSLYQTIADAIKTTFEADSWLGNSSNVTTIEATVRALGHEEFTKGFLHTELPVIQIIANLSGAGSDVFTTNELDYVIPVIVFSLSRAVDKSTVQTTADGLIEHIESVLREQRSSTKHLGIEAMVADVSTELAFEKRDNFYYALTETTCTVQKIVSI